MPDSSDVPVSPLDSAFGFRTSPPERIEVDFGAGPRSMVRSMTVLNVGHAAPADGPVDFTALDAFPQAKTIEWSGTARGLPEALTGRPRFHYLNWHDAAGDIDLSQTGVKSLRLYGCAGVRSLRLPESPELLMLGGPSADLRVEGTGEPHGLRLILFPAGGDVVIPGGVLHAHDVWLRVGGELSAAALSGFTALTDLRITFDDSPGKLRDPQSLTGHRNLRGLALDSAFDLDPAAFPVLPSLRRLHLTWTRKSVAAALRARFRGTGVKVGVYGALTDTWLAEQKDNPFMDWVIDSKGAAKAAGAAYARVREVTDTGTAERPVPAAEAERALRLFIADVNALDEKYSVLDTAERERVGDVYDELAGRFGLDPRAEAADWFDEDRRF